jgi:hypothetical protein
VRPAELFGAVANYTSNGPLGWQVGRTSNWELWNDYANSTRERQCISVHIQVNRVGKAP